MIIHSFILFSLNNIYFYYTSKETCQNMFVFSIHPWNIYVILKTNFLAVLFLKFLKYWMDLFEWYNYTAKKDVWNNIKDRFSDYQNLFSCGTDLSSSRDDNSFKMYLRISQLSPSYPPRQKQW